MPFQAWLCYICQTTMFPKSDLVKIAQEMKWMLNKLVREGVEMLVVGGVLITGFTMYTFKMELIDASIYRMVQLSKTLLFRNLQGLVLLPTIVSNLLQLKVWNPVTESKAILIQIKEYYPYYSKQNKRSISKKSQRHRSRIQPPPSLSWLQDAEFSLFKRKKKE